MEKNGKQEVVEWHLVIAGDVQGVGFRATAYQIANSLSLVGSAQNLPDGKVEIFVQGTRHELEHFMQRIQDSFLGYIREMNKQENPPNIDRTYFLILR
jgi:acylphosphatase